MAPGRWFRVALRDSPIEGVGPLPIRRHDVTAPQKREDELPRVVGGPSEPRDGAIDIAGDCLNSDVDGDAVPVKGDVRRLSCIPVSARLYQQ